MKRLRKLIPWIVLTGFAILSLWTQKDYGWNWDLFQHLARGQAYYRYFTTGMKDNQGVTPYNGRLSYYERTPFDFRWADKMTIGHPPTTDILLATVNQIFFKRFGIVADMTAYQVYGVVVTLVAAVSILLWSYEISGWIGASVAVISYYGFPLLFSEQHFNIKDPAITAYSAIMLYLFWLGTTRKKSLIIFFAAIVSGVSLGTKFNVLFIFPVLAFWLVWYGKKIWKNVSILTFPIVAFLVFLLTYPALWDSPVKNVMSVISYYQTIGGSRCPYVPATGMWFVRCMDWETLRLLIVTIPLPTLILAGIGSVAALVTIGRYKFAPLLWFLYVSSVIARVILPVNSLYGESLRQIMEIIVPLSLLSGFGAHWMVRTKRVGIGILLFILYIPVLFRLAALHPNENLYTNVLADLFWKNAKSKLINGIVSYGNAYKPGIDWINSYAEPDANVSLVTGIGSAVPENMFRPDIIYGSYWSGYEQKGEYLIELIDADDSHATQFFPYKYVTTILTPLYEKTVDGFPIVRVWKNDRDHTKFEYRNPADINIIHQSISKDEVVIQLPTMAQLRELTITTNDKRCRQSVMNAYVLVSRDEFEYRRMYETVEEMNRLNADVVHYPLAGDVGSYIKLFTYAPNACDLSNVHFSVVGFK